MVYFFVYEYDLHHRYETSQSNSEDIFEQTLPSFGPSQLFESSWLHDEVDVYECDLDYTYETS